MTSSFSFFFLCVGMHTPRHLCKDQSWCILLPFLFWLSNLGLKFWWQSPLPTEASSPPKYFILMRWFGVYLESFRMVTDRQKDHSPNLNFCGEKQVRDRVNQWKKPFRFNEVSIKAVNWCTLSLMNWQKHPHPNFTGVEVPVFEVLLDFTQCSFPSNDSLAFFKINGNDGILRFSVADFLNRRRVLKGLLKF